MPSRSRRFCSSPGCRTLVDGGRCARHQARAAMAEARRKAALDAARPSSGERGYDADWRAVRRQYLAAHPSCVGWGATAGNCSAPAVEVDHILPVSTHPELRLRWSNLRGLCKRCHSRRTASEQGFAVGTGTRRAGGASRQGPARAMPDRPPKGPRAQQPRGLVETEREAPSEN